jgi:hypothetical protein
MMDFVKLVKYLKSPASDYNAKDSAVIVVGGSYGGMLGVWMRQTYPHIF